MATMARCRKCAAEFALACVLDGWRCCCPLCDTPLADNGGDRATILRKAAVADRLETQLVETLSQLSSIRGNFDLSISPIVIRLLTKVDWDRQLRDDVSFAQREIERLRTAVANWSLHLEGQTDEERQAHANEFSQDMRELANRLRKVGESMDQSRVEHTPPDQGGPMRSAASSVDKAAHDLARGQGSHTRVDDALDDAIDAISRSVPAES
jgi:hypothetical protein